VLAENIAAAVRGGWKRPFVFSTLGQLAAIGKRKGVANILGVNFSGFIAWWLWRTV
jgi:NADH dehydrogenase